MFALLGLLAGPAARSWNLRPIAAAGSVAALWFAVADFQFVADTPESLARAAAMNPWHARYQLRLFDRTHDPKALDSALHLNPHDASVLIEAGLRAELDANPRKALQYLLEASKQDRGYLPRWTLANYHLRASELDEFWRWSKAAASVSRGIDLRPLLELASRVEADPEKFASQLLPENRAEAPRALVQYLILSNPKETRGLSLAANRLLTNGTAMPDRNYVVAAVERFIEAKDADTSWNLWKGMLEKGWLPQGAGQGFVLSPPLREGFDWRLYPIEGIVLSSDPGVITVSLSGTQTEAEWPTLQKVARVEPNTRYRFKADYTTEGIREHSGLRWRIVDEADGKMLATGPAVAASEGGQTAVEFTAPESKLVRLQLVSAREPGFTRTSGSIRFTAAEVVSLESESQP
jgi:hypothetical protein